MMAIMRNLQSSIWYENYPQMKKYMLQANALSDIALKKEIKTSSEVYAKFKSEDSKLTKEKLTKDNFSQAETLLSQVTYAFAVLLTAKEKGLLTFHEIEAFDDIRSSEYLYRFIVKMGIYMASSNVDAKGAAAISAKFEKAKMYFESAESICNFYKASSVYYAGSYISIKTQKQQIILCGMQEENLSDLVSKLIVWLIKTDNNFSLREIKLNEEYSVDISIELIKKFIQMVQEYYNDIGRNLLKKLETAPDIYREDNVKAAAQLLIYRVSQYVLVLLGFNDDKKVEEDSQLSKKILSIIRAIYNMAHDLGNIFPNIGLEVEPFHKERIEQIIGGKKIPQRKWHVNNKQFNELQKNIHEKNISQVKDTLSQKIQEKMLHDVEVIKILNNQGFNDSEINRTKHFLKSYQEVIAYCYKVLERENNKDDQQLYYELEQEALDFLLQLNIKLCERLLRKASCTKNLTLQKRIEILDSISIYEQQSIRIYDYLTELKYKKISLNQLNLHQSRKKSLLLMLQDALKNPELELLVNQILTIESEWLISTSNQNNYEQIKNKIMQLNQYQYGKIIWQIENSQTLMKNVEAIHNATNHFLTLLSEQITMLLNVVKEYSPGTNNKKAIKHYMEPTNALIEIVQLIAKKVPTLQTRSDEIIEMFAQACHASGIKIGNVNKSLRSDENQLLKKNVEWFETIPALKDSIQKASAYDNADFLAAINKKIKIDWQVDLPSEKILSVEQVGSNLITDIKVLQQALSDTYEAFGLLWVWESLSKEAKSNIFANLNVKNAENHTEFVKVQIQTYAIKLHDIYIKLIEQIIQYLEDNQTAENALKEELIQKAKNYLKETALFLEHVLAKEKDEINKTRLAELSAMLMVNHDRILLKQPVAKEVENTAKEDEDKIKSTKNCLDIQMIVFPEINLTHENDHQLDEQSKQNEKDALENHCVLFPENRSVEYKNKKLNTKDNKQSGEVVMALGRTTVTENTKFLWYENYPELKAAIERAEKLFAKNKSQFNREYAEALGLKKETDRLVEGIKRDLSYSETENKKIVEEFNKLIAITYERFATLYVKIETANGQINKIGTMFIEATIHAYAKNLYFLNLSMADRLIAIAKFSVSLTKVQKLAVLKDAERYVNHAKVLIAKFDSIISENNKSSIETYENAIKTVTFILNAIVSLTQNSGLQECANRCDQFVDEFFLAEKKCDVFRYLFDCFRNGRTITIGLDEIKITMEAFANLADNYSQLHKNYIKEIVPYIQNGQLDKNIVPALKQILELIHVNISNFIQVGLNFCNSLNGEDKQYIHTIIQKLQNKLGLFTALLSQHPKCETSVHLMDDKVTHLEKTKIPKATPSKRNKKHPAKIEQEWWTSVAAIKKCMQEVKAMDETQYEKEAKKIDQLLDISDMLAAYQKMVLYSEEEINSPKQRLLNFYKYFAFCSRARLDSDYEEDILASSFTLNTLIFKLLVHRAQVEKTLSLEQRVFHIKEASKYLEDAIQIDARFVKLPNSNQYPSSDERIARLKADMKDLQVYEKVIKQSMHNNKKIKSFVDQLLHTRCEFIIFNHQYTMYSFRESTVSRETDSRIERNVLTKRAAEIAKLDANANQAMMEKLKEILLDTAVDQPLVEQLTILFLRALYMQLDIVIKSVETLNSKKAIYDVKTKRNFLIAGNAIQEKIDWIRKKMPTIPVEEDVKQKTTLQSLSANIQLTDKTKEASPQQTIVAVNRAAVIQSDNPVPSVKFLPEKWYAESAILSEAIDKTKQMNSDELILAVPKLIKKLIQQQKTQAKKETSSQFNFSEEILKAKKSELTELNKMIGILYAASLSKGALIKLKNNKNFCNAEKIKQQLQMAATVFCHLSIETIIYCLKYVKRSADESGKLQLLLLAEVQAYLQEMDVLLKQLIPDLKTQIGSSISALKNETEILIGIFNALSQQDKEKIDTILNQAWQVLQQFSTKEISISAEMTKANNLPTNKIKKINDGFNILNDNCKKMLALFQTLPAIELRNHPIQAIFTLLLKEMELSIAQILEMQRFIPKQGNNQELHGHKQQLLKVAKDFEMYMNQIKKEMPEIMFEFNLKQRDELLQAFNPSPAMTQTVQITSSPVSKQKINSPIMSEESEIKKWMRENPEPTSAAYHDLFKIFFDHVLNYTSKKVKTPDGLKVILAKVKNYFNALKEVLAKALQTNNVDTHLLILNFYLDLLKKDININNVAFFSPYVLLNEAERVSRLTTVLLQNNGTQEQQIELTSKVQMLKEIKQQMLIGDNINEAKLKNSPAIKELQMLEQQAPSLEGYQNSDVYLKKSIYKNRAVFFNGTNNAEQRSLRAGISAKLKTKLS